MYISHWHIIGTHLEKGSESECEIRGCSIHAVEVTMATAASSMKCHVIVLADPKAACNSHVWRPWFRHGVRYSFSSAWLLSLELCQRSQQCYENLSHTQNLYNILLTL